MHLPRDLSCRNSDNEILRLDKEGTLTTVGNADIGGSVLALGFSSGSEGLTFSDGSTMTTAASKLAGRKKLPEYEGVRRFMNHEQSWLLQKYNGAISRRS